MDPNNAQQTSRMTSSLSNYTQSTFTTGSEKKHLDLTDDIVKLLSGLLSNWRPAFQTTTTPSLIIMIH